MPAPLRTAFMGIAAWLMQHDDGPDVVAEMRDMLLGFVQRTPAARQPAEAADDGLFFYCGWALCSGVRPSSGRKTINPEEL